MLLKHADKSCTVLDKFHVVELTESDINATLFNHVDVLGWDCREWTIGNPIILTETVQWRM